MDPRPGGGHSGISNAAPLIMMAMPMTDVVVRDGSTMCVRHAEQRAIPVPLKFLQSRSPQSLYYRFHGTPALAEPDVRVLVGADRGPATTLVAESGGRIVAFAGYYPRQDAPPRAEV